MRHPARARSVIVALAALLTAPVAPAEIQNLSLPPQPAGGPTTGEYWALIIGIDNYHHELPLQTAVKDAMEVRDELAQRYGVRRERLIALFNEQATRQNIAYALFRLSNEAKPDDVVLIYFAGHAQYDKDDRLQWWVPVEGTPLTPETLLTDAAIQEELQDRNANQVHLFHVMAGVAREVRLAPPNLQAERQALEQEQRQAEEHAKLDAARRQEEERNRLAAEETRRAAEEQARLEAERVAREQETLDKQQAEQKRLETERNRLAEEKARQDAAEQARQEAERHATQERLAREQEDRAKKQAEQQALLREEAQRKLTEERRRTEERSKPIEEARVRPFTPLTPPPAGQ